jgi:hypothetical protein
MMKIASSLLTVALASLSGCATLFSGGPDQISISTNPPGARIFVDNNEVGATPTTVTLDRKNSFGAIRVEAPGYQPAAIQRMKKMNNIAFLNLFNLLGWAVDLVTGNYQEFDRTPVNLTLVPLGYQGAPPAGWQQPPPYPNQPPAPQAPPGYPPPPAYPPQQPYPPQYPPPAPQYPPPQPAPAPRRP